MRARRFACGAAVLAAVVNCSRSDGGGTPAAGSAAERVLTSLRESACTAPPAAVASEYARRDLGVQECQGANGWRVLLVSSDANSWLDLEGPGGRWSSERAIVYEEPIGLFPGVDTARDVEWHRRDGEIAAAIVTLRAQDPQTLTTSRTRYLVVRLQPNGPCVVGRADSEDAGRALIAGDAPCRAPA